MTRTVLITGSEGYLGRALRARFTEMGDRVVGVDCVSGPHTDHVIQLDDETLAPVAGKYDIVICNAKTHHWGAHHMLAQMATSAIVNVSSIYGLVGNDREMYRGTEIEPTPAWYVAAKSTLIGLTKWQAANLAPVRSNCVCAGGIWRGHSDTFLERYAAKVPLRRMATEDDIVGPIVWLCSDEAKYITGAIIPVDGGYTAL